MRLIDADALIPMMRYATTDSEIGVFPILIGFKAIKKVIDEQPTVGTQWIPVTEALPEEDKTVLISYRYKDGEGDTSHINISITSYGQAYFGGHTIHDYKHWRPPFEYFERNYEVVAWMPLPEPFEGEKDG